MDQPKRTDDRLRTSKSLLNRIKNPDDHQSWQDFANMYSGLILGVAVKTGLTPDEAQDVLQETLISVNKNIKDFTYDPSRSFKAWLMQATRWKINDRFRKRLRFAQRPPPHSDETGRTKTVEKIPDPAGNDLELSWNEEWQKHVAAKALERVRKRIDPKHFQIFHAFVTKEVPAEKVAKALGVTTTQVFTVKKRVLAQVKKEAAQLEKHGS